jgi:hypothetical protein
MKVNILKYSLLLVLVLLCSAVHGDGRVAKVAYRRLWQNMKGKIDDAVDQALVQVNDILILNNTHPMADLKVQSEALKKKIGERLKYDLVSSIRETARSRKQGSGPLSSEEQITFAEKVQTRWEDSVQDEIERWRLGSLKYWFGRAKRAWVGMEHVVADKIFTFHDWIKKYSPLPRRKQA